MQGDDEASTPRERPKGQEGIPRSVHVHPAALCETETVGEGTRIWAFAHVLPGARIGRDCNVCDGVFIENDVVVGDRVTLKSGVQLWDGVRLEDDVFVGPNATFTNDPFPRSKRHVPPAVTLVQRGASIGANATLLPGIVIGRDAMVGAGSVVTSDVPPNAVVAGNPARVVRYVETHDHQEPDVELVGGAALVELTTAQDVRGRLMAAEAPREIPFQPVRVFVVLDVPSARVRGAHAHRTCEQFLVAVRGEVTVVLDDGDAREEIRLDSPGVGLYIPPMVWASQYRYSGDAVLLVAASHEYDPEDYIREYSEFRKVLGGA